MIIYSPYWEDIEPYVFIGEDGHQHLTPDVSKDIEEKFWRHQAAAADGFGIDWVKEHIPPEYRYIIANRQKFNW